MSKLGPISHFSSPVSCDSLVLQDLRCAWELCVVQFVLSGCSHSLNWISLDVQHGTSWQVLS
ncbi:unnamed protein product [Staurois parvus]|uniref:Uncharacterized protein n=1 Tax=Staurois parvus TaxID=386267 RepID=A0ABN9DNH2_9NEOB|nr:unnamed protein product [Staurois parvus]